MLLPDSERPLSHSSSRSNFVPIEDRVQLAAPLSQGDQTKSGHDSHS